MFVMSVEEMLVHDIEARCQKELETEWCANSAEHSDWSQWKQWEESGW